MAHFTDYRLGGIRVGNINFGSGIFVGTNRQLGWRRSSKINQASGNILGDGNFIIGAHDDIHDSDLLDTYVQKPNPYPYSRKTDVSRGD